MVQHARLFRELSQEEVRISKQTLYRYSSGSRHHERRRGLHDARDFVHVRLDLRRGVSKRDPVCDARERCAAVPLVEARTEDHVLEPWPNAACLVRPANRGCKLAHGLLERTGGLAERPDSVVELGKLDRALETRDLRLEARERVVHDRTVRGEIERQDRLVHEA
ncbi:hypothetical protein PybrP1_010601 [[Pythium] brassicae (nom. inval.)]|nr:hypothetical protein PybrP1_010601 [[Pythium] brassicae (nom. inval.)]